MIATPEHTPVFTHDRRASFLAVAGHVLALALLALWPSPAPSPTLARVISVTLSAPKPLTPPPAEPEFEPEPASTSEMGPDLRAIGDALLAQDAERFGQVLRDEASAPTPDGAPTFLRAPRPTVAATLRAIAACFDAEGRRIADCSILGFDLAGLSALDPDALADVGTALGPEFAGMTRLELEMALGLREFWPRNAATVGAAPQVFDGALGPSWGGPLIDPGDKARDPGFGD